MSWTEAKWTVDNLLQKLGQPPGDMVSFSAYSESANSAALNFREPSNSYDANGNLICAVEGVMIRMSDEGYPTKPTEGTLVIDNTELGAYADEVFIVDNLITEKTYYLSAFPYSVQGVYNMYGNAVNHVEVTCYDFTSSINVTFPEGAVVTCECDGRKYIAPTTDGNYTFRVHSTGDWVITATSGAYETSETVTIDSNGQSEEIELTFTYIYGISRDTTSSSPAWVRTDNAVGMTATATVGTVAGASDFDDCYPWKGIVRETLPTGDVMVKIPKFWYQRYLNGNVEFIRIASKEVDGFELHPAFNHSGVETEYIYVGAYKTSSSYLSVSGATPQTDQTRATMRNNAKSKGDGWGIIDISTLSAIQMLILVEFANNNVQSVIGRGYCDGNSAACKTGTCDGVSNLTGILAGTDGKVDVVWRGIEGLWGNIWEWVDGVNWNGALYYVCNTPSKYADDASTNYEKLSFTGSTSWSSSYITKEGLDTGNNPHIMLPSTAGSGSETTYMCDACWSSTGWRVFRHGGLWSYGSICGLFTAHLNDDSSNSNTYSGSRLLYIPS